MQELVIKGPSKINGSIEISGSKNASLPILISTVLAKGSCVIGNVPNLRDTKFLISILNNLGCKINFKNNVVAIHSSHISKKIADYDYVRQMRASIVLLGPVIGRYSSFKIALPGGCAIEKRLRHMSSSWQLLRGLPSRLGLDSATCTVVEGIKNMPTPPPDEPGRTGDHIRRRWLC